MRTFALLLAFVPSVALAGAQYTAEDVIRYFEQANASAQPPSPSIARTAPAADRGIAIGEPGTRGVVIGGAPAKGIAIGDAPAKGALVGELPGKGGVVIGGVAPGEAPLVIPMTGAKAGYTVPPTAAAAPLVTAAAATPSGYDLMVTFEIDSAVLTPQARQNLDAFAQALRSPALSRLRFAVEGHTDATGSPEHNLKLSENRAASVVGYLVAHGVDAARLISAGYGETRPRIDDPGHPDNRRVETRPIE